MYIHQRNQSYFVVRFLKTKFGRVISCMHISAVIQSQRRPICVDSSTGSNSRMYATAI